MLVEAEIGEIQGIEDNMDKKHASIVKKMILINLFKIQKLI